MFDEAMTDEQQDELLKQLLDELNSAIIQEKIARQQLINFVTRVTK